jgi:hypothetical protein
LSVLRHDAEVGQPDSVTVGVHLERAGEIDPLSGVRISIRSL